MRFFTSATTLSLSLMAALLSSQLSAQVGQILWEDNFDSFDVSVWSADIGDGCPEICGWGNQELQYYQSENISIEEIPGEPGNFALVLEARNEAVGGKAFTSGKVTSRNNLAVKYGMIECRVKVPDDLSKGLWPAVWMLGTNEVSDGWPKCGEVDLMEMGQNSQFRNDQGFSFANENNLIGANVIFYSDDACAPDNLTCAASISFDHYYNQPYYDEAPLTDRFIIYRMYWDENSIRLTLEDDGRVHNFYTGPFPISGESSELQKPFYLLMNLAVGGNFTDAATNTQVTADLPGKMYIDYIRVRQWNGQGEVFTPGTLMANAGADQKVGAGDTVFLDASGSYGPIESYSWKQNGEEVATTHLHSTTLSEGTYTFELTVTDSEGATSSDQITVVVGDSEIGEVIWEDDFSTFNADVWNMEVGDGCDEGLCGWGNWELQSYQEDNVYIEEIPEEPGNFALVIEAREEVAGNSQFTSGKVTTENKLAIHYGVVEVRMKVPDVADGLWPAAWLLGINHRTVGWPRCGEIDMMEMGHAASTRQDEGFFGSANNFVGGNLLWYTGQACSTDNQSCAASIAFDKFYTTPYTPASPLNNRFVTYRIYWNESQIRLVAVDNGIEHDLYAAPFPIGPNEEAFQKPFYFLLNMAVGGTFTDRFNPGEITAPMPAKMYIDYVRVRKWNGTGSVVYPGGELLANGGGEVVESDLDQDGFEQVFLDGSGSYGAITAYEWSENGVVLSQDAIADLTLTTGVHFLTLKVTDDFGNVSTDIVKVDIRELLWNEEFDTFDTSTWTAEIGDGCPELCGWGNQELQYYQEENVYVEPITGEAGNNALVIEAKKESVGGKGFTSGRVSTKDNVSIRYGMVETRIKVPNDLSTGLWPAAWLLGTNLDEVGWPRAGEIDMMEMGHNTQFRIDQEVLGYTENEVVAGNIIFYSDEACGGDPNCAASISYDKWYNKLYVTETPLTDRFLTYRMYWDPNQIRLTAVDGGVEYDLYTAPFPLGADEGAFNKPFYYLLNMAVGGNFTDASIDSQVTAPLPGKMLIDYVRVFRWNGHGEVATGDGIFTYAGPDIIALDKGLDGSEIVTLDASGSAHHTGEILSYSWSIDGQEVATGEVAPLALSRGAYEVLLTVTDDLGNTGTDIVLVTVSNGGLAPVADAGPDQEVIDDNGDDLVTVSLDGSLSEEAGAPIVGYRWLENGLELATGVTANVQLSTGTHIITLEVTDEDESVGTDEVVITVIDPDNVAPVADAGEDISVNDVDGDDLVEVTLDASGSSDSDGTIESYEWIFNGEVIASGETTQVVLSTGTYSLTLEVMDNDGVTSTDELMITVTDPDNNAPNANAGADQLIIDGDLDGEEEVTLDASGSSDSDGTIQSYLWKLEGVEIGTDDVLTLTLTLGEHLITLQVTDNDGITTADSTTVYVNQLPSAVAGDDIKATDSDSSGDEIVSLDASGSSDPDGTIAAYSWVFEEAEIGSSETFDYAFPIGANEVTLVITDNFGSQVSDEITVHVASLDNIAPTANAGSDIEEQANANGSQDIQLDGSGSNDPDGSIYSYSWRKNGIEIASGQSPTVSLAIGVHTIDLLVTDNEGAEGTDEVLVTVIERVNVALNKPVTTSSVENAGTPGSFAVDGDGGSRWASSFSDPQWIYVDLQGQYRLREVVLVWEAAYGSAYQIQVSNDASNWTTVFTESDGNGETDELAVDAVGRYVRMYGTARATEYGYSLYEFEIYGTAVTSQQDATLKDLKIGGSPLQDFNSNVLKYDIFLSSGDGVPVVEATSTSPQATVQVYPASSVPGSTIIDVTSEDGSVTLTYTVNFIIEAGGQNLALNKPAVSSSEENIETSASNAFDGDPLTRWSSAFADPQWIHVDLGSVREIGRVVLVWEAAYATAYQIQVSDDASSWTTIHTETSGNGGTDEIQLSGTGRYVRMYGTARATPYGYSLFEFEVYAKVKLPPLEVSIDPGISISWLAENGVLYQVQWASEMLGDDTVWYNLDEPITGDGSTMTVIDSAGPPRNFYRVVSIPSQ